MRWRSRSTGASDGPSILKAPDSRSGSLRRAADSLGGRSVSVRPVPSASPPEPGAVGPTHPIGSGVRSPVRGRMWCGHERTRMTSYAVARLEDIDELTDGRRPFRPVRHHFGITSFGVTAWTAREAGDRIINEPDGPEPDSLEELYPVVRGRAVFELDGDRVAAPAGTFVFAPPGVKRTAFAEEPETTILALGGTPGKAYEPDGWELWAPLSPLYDAGEYAEAADRGRQLVADHPQYAGLLYNLACCESLAGRTVDALEHLGRAIDRSERFRSYAKDDSDFAAIRDEPGFQELIGR